MLPGTRKALKIVGVDTEPDPNRYSPAWFQVFHTGISASRTEQQTAFVVSACPLPAYRRILDLCCGMGRHARALAARDYKVTGGERDPHASTKARARASGPIYVKAGTTA